MAAAALSFLVLPKMSAGSPRLVVSNANRGGARGFVASFSFGAGLAIWPTLLFLAWCLRLPRYSVVPLALASLAAAAVFALIPPHYWRFQITLGIALVWFCRLLGNSGCRLLGRTLPIHWFAKYLGAFRPFTILRDPVDRVMSLFRFFKSRLKYLLPNVYQALEVSLTRVIASQVPSIYE
jgi:hypothetical protein